MATPDQMCAENPEPMTTRQAQLEQMVERISPTKRAFVDGALGIPTAAARIGILWIFAAFFSEFFIPATFTLLILGALSKPGMKKDVASYYTACGWITRDQDSA